MTTATDKQIDYIKSLTTISPLNTVKDEIFKRSNLNFDLTSDEASQVINFLKNAGKGSAIISTASINTAVEKFLGKIGTAWFTVVTHTHRPMTGRTMTMIEEIVGDNLVAIVNYFDENGWDQFNIPNIKTAMQTIPSDETIAVDGFWMMDNENLSGESQYVLTEQDIENEYNEYLEIFDGDMSIDDFKSEWVFVDADDIQTDSYLRDSLEIDMNRGVIFEQAIIDFIQNAINNPLTESEQEIIDMLKSEPLASNKQIAQALGKSENTVRNQLNSIYAKHDITSSRGVDARLKLYWVLGWINSQ